jgi:hypothetical protein
VSTELAVAGSFDLAAGGRGGPAGGLGLTGGRPVAGDPSDVDNPVVHMRRILSLRPCRTWVALLCRSETGEIRPRSTVKRS